MTTTSTKLIGVLTADGPRSLVPFLTALKEEYARQGVQDQQEMLCLSIQDTYDQNMETALMRGVQKLIGAGVDVIVLPSGPSYAYLPEIQAASSVHVINMVEATIESLPEAATNVALLATQETVESEVYQEMIEASGRMFLADPQWQTIVNDLIDHTDQPAYRERLALEWQDLVNTLHAANVHVAIIASTELSSFSKPTSELVLIDAAQCLAQAVVKRYV